MNRRIAFSKFGEVNWCEALGTVLANALVRAGVGFVRIVDRDFVDVLPSLALNYRLTERQNLRMAASQTLAACGRTTESTAVASARRTRLYLSARVAM